MIPHQSVQGYHLGLPAKNTFSNRKILWDASHNSLTELQDDAETLTFDAFISFFPVRAAAAGSNIKSPDM